MSGAAAAALSGAHASGPGPAGLRDISLAVQRGEILSLLGAAGSGKSRVLAMLAGFARLTAGGVLVDGEDAAALPPRRRRVALVEHGLGLFEGMTVAQNLAFADPAGTLVAGLLDLADLAAVQRLRPAALGAGQRARLAVARALAAAPRALLLDEPAAGLDPREIQALFALLRAARAGGAAILYATAEAGQAIPLGDRMAVLAGGAIRQAGPPQAVYDDPADAVVARLTGPVNVLAGEVLAIDEDGVRVRLDGGATVEARAGADAKYGFRLGGRCAICVRPERLAVAAVAPEQMGEGALPAEVETLEFHGDRVTLRLRAGVAAILAYRPTGISLRGIAPGRTVSVAWQAHHATALRTISG